MARKVHHLKAWVVPFGAVWSGSKPYEIRKNDRDYRVGDDLHLREWDHETECYTGPCLRETIGYMTPGGEWGLPPDLCVLGFERRSPGQRILECQCATPEPKEEEGR